MQVTEAQTTRCGIVEDPWLGEILGCSAGRLEVSSSTDASVADWRHAIEGFQRARSTVAADLFLTAKVATDDVATVATLSQAGLYVVDVNVTLERRLEPDGPPTSKTVMPETTRSEAVRIARVSDEDLANTDGSIVARGTEEKDAFVEIARSAFRYSRFHLDPAISPTAADAVKASWFANSLSGKRGDQVWLAWWNDRPAGFLTSVWVQPTAMNSPGQQTNGGTAVIDLVAVSPHAQGAGIGRALTRAFVHHYTSDAPCSLRVGTQVANLPAQSLYLSCGFRPAQATYVMHGHFSAHTFKFDH